MSIRIDTITGYIKKGKEYVFTPCPKVVLKSFYGLDITQELINSWGYTNAIVSLECTHNHIQHDSLTIHMLIVVPHGDTPIALSTPMVRDMNDILQPVAYPEIVPAIQQEIIFQVHSTAPTRVVSWWPPRVCKQKEFNLYAQSINLPDTRYERTLIVTISNIIRAQAFHMHTLLNGQLINTFSYSDLLMLFEAGYHWTLGDTIGGIAMLIPSIPRLGDREWTETDTVREWAEHNQDRMITLPLKGYQRY
jgi:hypothetical protein